MNFILILAIFQLYTHTNAQIQWQGNWASNCDFFGNDLSSAICRSEECGGKCANTAGCTHFSWSITDGGTCWMKNKKGGISKGEAIYKLGAMCGFVENSAPGPDPLPDTGSGKLITMKEFTDAVRAPGYETPSEAKYNALINQYATAGGISSKRELAHMKHQNPYEARKNAHMSKMSICNRI